jgi:hypothetical protein
MRRRLATLAAVSMFALALGASPTLAAGSPLTHASFPATVLNDQGPLCGYTFASGEVTYVFSTADALDGAIEAAHVTLHNVVAERAGASYKVVGVEIFNDLKGHLTMKMMFVSHGGGIADSLNVVFRAGRNFDPTPENPFNGALVALENDTCHYYG